MYYPLGRFEEDEIIESARWNPLDAQDVTLSNRNYSALVNTQPPSRRPHAAWDNVQITSGKWYWEVHIVELDHSGSNLVNLSFGLRNGQDGMGTISASNELSNSYEKRELRFISDGGGSVLNTTIPDIAVWHSNSGDAPFTVHDLIEVQGNYLAKVLPGVSGFTASDILMFAFDRDLGNLWIGKNGTFFNGGNPAAGTNPQFTNLDCSEAQYGSLEVPWRFFFATTSVDYATRPLRFNLATGNSLFPQIYSAPTGFTPLVPHSSITYSGTVTNFRDSSGDMMSSSEDLLTCFSAPAHIALNAVNGFSVSAGIMQLGGKYYWEVQPNVTGPQVWYGTCEFGSSAGNHEDAGIQCLWNQIGTLKDGSASMTIDTTGVSGWALPIDTDIIHFAFDLGAGKLWLGKNNTWFNGGNPATGVNPQFSNIPIGNTWVAKVLIRSNARGSIFMGQVFPFNFAAPAGFTQGIPLILPYAP